MSRQVKFRVKDGVAIVTLAHPPVNALGTEMRQGLWDVFGRIATHDQVRAVIVIAEGDLFSAGADIREFGAKPARPTLRQVFDRIEDCPHPVVAGLHGATLGGGAELALACHYRLAAPGSMIGLPEVTLGLVPGAGGTQRLPRLIGAEAALALMLGGRTISVDEARKAGLIDGIAAGHLPSVAFSFASELAQKGAGPRPTRARRDGMVDGAAYLAKVTERRKALATSRFFAPKQVIDCVEAALLLPFEAGQAFEADAFDRCRTNPQSRALRHMFVAERRIADDLLPRADGPRTPTPAAEPILRQLRGALGAASAHLAQGGGDRDQIDSAALAFGLAHTPFSGGTPGATGPEVEMIQRRLIAAMMAEGARMVGTGIVPRASDIDALAVHGMGFPRWRGGPMKAAHLMGLLPLMREMEGWAQESSLWSVPRLLREAVKYADGFDALPLVVKASQTV